MNSEDAEKVEISNDDWKQKLAPDEYRVLRQGGTEAPFSGEHYKETRKGMYLCKACGNPLFPSDAKFTTSIAGLRGWPSFDQAIPGSVLFQSDDSDGMHRTEAVCSRCKSHLGHLFAEDEESKTGQHYCVNSVCLDFKPEE